MTSSATTDIPETDRKLFDPDAWLSAAVALDVIATRLRALDDRVTDVTELVRALAEIGVLGGLDDLAIDALLATAHGDVGDARAAIAPLLTQPRDVGKAARLLEDGARTLVREARLELEASAVMDYKLI